MTPTPPEELDMESPREIHESKHLRWTGRPSEEQLLGPLSASAPKPTVSFQPPPFHDWASSSVPVSDTFDGAPRRRFGGRDLVALAVVAAAIWFAVSGSEGLPFRSSSTAEPADATELVGTTVSFDRGELGSLPRNAAAQGTAANSSGDRGRAGATSPGGTGSKRHPKPPSSGNKSDPLLEANLPVVGTVTLDQPNIDLPGGTPTVPQGTLTVPDTGSLTVPTVTLPTLP
jgi:hypothetical protein